MHGFLGKADVAVRQEPAGVNRSDGVINKARELLALFLGEPNSLMWPDKFFIQFGGTVDFLKQNVGTREPECELAAQQSARRCPVFFPVNREGDCRQMFRKSRMLKVLVRVQAWWN